MNILGIDIGGTGIKAAPVNLKSGRLIKNRIRIDTPQPATPQNISRAVKTLVKQFRWKGLMGCAFPGVIKSGIVQTAANVDKSWNGNDLEMLLKKATANKTYAINDADAAGMAEVMYGRGLNIKGTVIMVTLGTGIGSAVFVNGVMVPNTELGHLIVRGKDAEKRASDRARKQKDLSWKKWGKNVSEYLELLEELFSPDLFIIGGGVSKDFEKYSGTLNVKCKVVAAKLLNEAGIIGAAAWAASNQNK